MINFEHKIILNTIDKLINGQDYRSEIVNAINVQFLDFSIVFFKEIIKSKLDNKKMDLDWYKNKFILNSNLKSDDIAIFAGMNKKTITNIHGSATKEVILDVAKNNFEYLSNLVKELEDNNTENLNIQIKLTYNGISAELTLTESLIVINALATKKIAIRGGAWSSIGKKVEKPLMLKLCELCKVPKKSINSEIFKKDGSLDFDREVDFKLYSSKIFKKDGSLDFDREVDFKLYSSKNKEIRCEVKLMGKGNPESADAVIARNTDIFIADTLSKQNKNQLNSLKIKWLELKNHTKEETVNNFYKILNDLRIENNR